MQQTVNQGGSTTTLSSSLNPSPYGATVTFTTTVTGPGATPTGTITFKDGAATIGTGTLNNGTASYSTGTLSIGTHGITAEYNGDSNHNASVSSELTQTVNKSTATVTLGGLAHTYEAIRRTQRP